MTTTVAETPLADIAPTVAATRAAFDTGRTKPIEWRVATLKRIASLLEQRSGRLEAALGHDLGRPVVEAWSADIGIVLADIGHTLAQLPSWVKPTKVPTPMSTQPASSKVIAEPLGVVCVIAPWNYPIQLTLMPAIAAISAGNAVVLKPSELAPHCAAELASIVEALADPAITIVQGGVAETTELLAQRFDHIIYTGNGTVARIVMKAAAEHLTPVTLELGGKSPVIVSKQADLDVAARRIAWGKFLNAGQTCIAPDHVLVERDVHDALVAKLGESVAQFYGADPKASKDFGRIVNSSHFHRLEKLLDSGATAVGGQTDADALYIAPTVLTDVTRDDLVMEQEIFGPILPVLAVDSVDDAIAGVNADDKPLALYVFSEDEREVDHVIASTSSGGAAVNGTIMHVANPNLPFGGVGPSGMGAYHGRAGFDAFSHHRAVLTQSTKVEPKLLYPPFTKAKVALIKRAFTMSDPRDLLARLRHRIFG